MTVIATGFRLDCTATILVAGVDEAGRGPLAGPVVASAVILDPNDPIAGVDDSKKLTAAARDALAPIIRERALAWAVTLASVAEIDTINILQATMLAMNRALQALHIVPTHIQVDGNRLPSLWGMPNHCTAEAVIGGDALIPAISAASILAKVTRDAMMVEYDAAHPGYGFALHKGYSTEVHLQALRTLGPSPIHRRSFAPVRTLLDGETSLEQQWLQLGL